MLKNFSHNIFNKLFGLSRSILKPLISFEEKLDANNRKQLESNSNLVYVLPERSFLENIALSLCCIENDFISPDKTLGEKNNHKSVSLRRPVFDNKKLKIKRRLPKNLKLVLEKDKKNLTLQPVSFLWGKSPEKERSIFKLLFSSSWAVSGPINNFFKLILHGRSLIITFHEPMQIADLYDPIKDLNQNALVINRYIRALFRKYKQASIGPDISHRRTLVKSLVRDKEVRNLINELSNESPRQKRKLKKRALRYANEICSDINYPMVRILYRGLTWFWNTRYEGININGLEEIKEQAKDHALVYVPCHRSHIDYLALSYVLIKEGMMVPQIAAGINLNIPLMGKVLRNGGAFYIRRSFGGRKLYSTILSQYLKRLMLRGNSIEFFPEGGRSRTGLSMEPKPGLLSMTLRSFASLKIQKVKVVPIYIGYEKIIEGGSYLNELMGGRKRRESFLDLAKVLKDFNNFLGNAYINFGEPIDLKDFLEKQGIDDYFIDSALDKPDWLIESTNSLGHEIIREINTKAVITSTSLVAMSLISEKNQTLTKDELIERIEFFKSLAKESQSNIWIPLKDPEEIISKTIELRLINSDSFSEKESYSLDEEKVALLSFYKNNTVHFYFIYSLICISLRISNKLKESEIMSAIRTTSSFLKDEIKPTWSEESLENILSHSLKVLEKKKVIKKENNSYLAPDNKENSFKEFISLCNLLEPNLKKKIS